MYAFREAVAAFKRAPVLTGLSSTMVGLALFVVGLFSLATYNLQLALSAIEERVEVVVYLRDDVRQSEIDLLLTELSNLEEVRQVMYISKREALERARTELPEFGELFMSSEVNPLPQSLEVELRPGSRNPEAVEKVAFAAEGYPFVEDAQYGEEWVNRLFALRRIGAASAGVLGIAFALVAALIIGTALRIAIFARRDEIYIMRLVGAKNSFIRRPFLLEGAMAGLAGGLLAWGLTYATYRGVYAYLFEVAWVPGRWVAAGLLAGTAFGAFASALAIRRHLREI
ncbi:MAG: ABC transporter permease [Gemmatimonadetes bacterium]|nr:ABC transporter permease [Gemmatimonadota bacterium]NNL30881.1 ABC transporter permease [Gemmatimonadota bacterium]